MRVTKLSLLALVAVAISACTSVAPLATPVASSQPGTSLTPTIGPASVPPGSSPALSSPSLTAPQTAPATSQPTRTPRPTKKPTPTPSVTPASIEGDIEVAFEPSSIPSPFYVNTDYTIRVYISALGTQNLPNVHVKLVAKDEGVSYKFDTGPVAITDSYYHDVVVNLPASGPSALILTATMPDGYVDTNKANNLKSVDIEVSPAP